MTATKRIEVDVTIEKHEAARLFNLVYTIPNRTLSEQSADVNERGEEFRLELQGVVNQAVRLALAAARESQSR